MLFYIGSGILGAIAIYCLWGMKKAYDKEQVLPLHVSVAIWILDTVHLLLVLIASVQGILALAFNKTIALMERSGLAFILAIVLITGIHLYNIWLEEPYLKRIFGEEYLRYKSSTPRYIGILKKKQNGPHVA